MGPGTATNLRAPTALGDNGSMTGAGDSTEVAPTWPGSHQPLGATWSPDSTNFAVSAPEAWGVEVCLFDDVDGREVETRHVLTEKTLGIWHGAVPGLRPGQRYGFRADGPWEPQHGRVFNQAKLLVDPYARAISGGIDDSGPVYGYRRDNPSRQ